MWRGFLRGTHTDDQIESLFRHLQACDKCTSLLDSLPRESSDDSVLEALNAIASDDSLLNEPAYLRLQAKIAANGDSTSNDSGATKNESGKPVEGDPRIRRSHLGRFEIIRVIGIGGFGIVYLAHDPRLQRKVALKVPRHHALMTPELRRRFVWEGQAAAKLQHANVLSLFEAGESDGLPYIASEYCTGPRLTEVLKDGAHFTPTEIARLTLCLAEAVEHAHSRGILHRDIKPNNIMLEFGSDHGVALSDGTYRVPKLVDFGLAKPLLPTMEASREATASGMVLGTPAYMAPETIDGVADVRADIYSLGVVLYELLTGKKPFQVTSVVDLVKRGEIGDPPPPSSLRSNLSLDLETICLKCLRTSPGQRYAGMAQLAEDLARFLAGEPIHARRVGPVERALRWTKRHPAKGLLVTMAFLLPLLALTGLVLHNRQLKVALDRAEKSEAAAKRSEERATENASVSSRLLYAERIRQTFLAWEGANDARYQEYLSAYAGSPTAEDLRGIEWFFLRNLGSLLTGESVRKSHDGGVCCLRFSTSGECLATAGIDGFIKIWDVETRAELRSWKAHDTDVNKLAFFRDDKSLVSVGDDGAVRVWDFMTGTLLQEIAASEKRLFEIAYDSTGGRLVAAGDDGVHFLRQEDGQESATIRVEKVRALALSSSLIAHPDNGQKRIRITNMESLKPVLEIDTSLIGLVNDIVFCADGGRLAVASRQGFGQIYHASDGAILASLKGHRAAVNTVRFFSTNDQLIATGSDDRTIRIWNAHGAMMKTIRGHSAEVWTLDFSPDERLLASGDSNGFVRFWNWQAQSDIGQNVTAESIGAADSVPAVNYFADGLHLATTCGDAAFQVLNLNGRRLRTFGLSSDAAGVVGLALSANDRYAAVPYASGRVGLWNLGTREVRRIAAHDGKVWDCEFSPDGRFLATCGEDRHCRLWDVETGESLADGCAHRKPVVSLAFAPDGLTLATASIDGTAKLWQVPSLRVRHVLEGHTDVVSKVVFSPLGRTVATCSHDHSILLWDVASGKLCSQQLEPGHKKWVAALAFAADEKTLISGDNGGVVCFWQISTGRNLFSLGTGMTMIKEIAIPKHQKGLAVLIQTSKMSDGTLYLWNLD